MTCKYLRVVAAVCLALLMGLPGEAGTRKGDKFLKQAQAAEVRKDWDLALQLYKQAVDEDPRDSGYLIGMQRTRFQASQMHVERGRQSRGDGKIEQAIGEFQKAIVADPSSAIAMQELKRTQDMLRNPAATAGGQVLTPVEQIRREASLQVDSMMGPPELKPALRRIPPVKLNNQPPRVLYESIGKIAGITTVIDPDGLGAVQTRNFNVELGESTVEQAFDYVALLTHTYWKPISATTIFVAQDTANKRRDYEDFVVKTFYITNASTVQEFQEISTAVRTITNITRVFTVNPQKALVVRGSADAVALAEKLVHDLDKPKSEVVIDVLIMEANSTRTRDLAATIASNGANGLTAGINTGITFTPRGTTTVTPTGTGTGTPATPSTGGINLGQLGHLSSADFSTTLPGLLLQAVLSDNKTKILNSPQVRASDGMKVSLKIGDRIPIATGSFQSGVGTVGGAPYAQTQFQFTDVGIKVEITPQVHSAEELTLHVSFEVSSVRSYTNIGGVQQPIIGQTTTEADIRLREGEINILSGLDATQDSSVVNGIPGLVNIPILGKIFFGSDHTEKDVQQLMIALQPHIVRTPDYTPENLRGVYSGPDQSLRLMYAPREDEGGSAPAAPVANPGVNPAPNPPQTAPGLIPGLVPGAGQATGPAPGTVPLPFQPPGQPGALPPPIPLGAGTRVAFTPGNVSVAPNTPFTVNVELNGAADAASVSPLRVKWDPAVLRLTDIAPGELLSRNGGTVSSIKDVRNDAGEATITVTRPAGPGISGSGPVAVLNFVAVAPGKGSVTVTEMGLKNSQSQAVPVALGSVAVAVQ
ncbi:MAG TPA: cohesin domain-containing protein [Bryobacteraceae bacterium]|nr:cohesin domain-containing protein [Bryobacteraceae bacterium]